MTVVPGRLAVAFGATTAALGPPTSVGVVGSLQAASSTTSAEGTIKACRIGVNPPGKGRRTLIRAGASAYHVFPLTGDRAKLITRSAGPLPITSFYYCRIAGVVLPWRDASVDARHTSRPIALAMKASSESIHHSDCEARLIVEHMPGFAWSADQDGKLRYLNQRFLEYTGKRIEDFDRVAGVASFARTEVLHPDDIADTLKAASHSVATGDPYVFEHRVRRFDGTYRWFRVSALRILDPMSQEIGWYGVDIDIDDQKRTDEALRQSEQSLNRLIETLPAMVWRATPDGEPDYINPRLANYTGRGLDGVGRGPEDLGRTLDDLVKLKVQNAMVHQDDLEAAARAWGRAHETGAFDLTARLRGADASYRWFQARAEPMRDAAGRIVYWYGVAVDIDDRKRVEEALQKSEQELRGIVDAIPQTIVVLDADGRGLYANRPLLDYTGLTMEQLLTPDSRGNPVLFHPDDWARLQDERRQALSRSMPFEIEWRVRRKDGQYRWFLVRYHPLRDEQGRILRWYAGGTDIDDRKRAEEALRATQAKLSRASKIATVSELAASIAHEISQPLA